MANTRQGIKLPAGWESSQRRILTALSNNVARLGATGQVLVDAIKNDSLLASQRLTKREDISNIMQVLNKTTLEISTALSKLPNNSNSKKEYLPKYDNLFQQFSTEEKKLDGFKAELETLVSEKNKIIQALQSKTNLTDADKAKLSLDDLQPKIAAIQEKIANYETKLKYLVDDLVKMNDIVQKLSIDVINQNTFNPRPE